MNFTPSTCPRSGCKRALALNLILGAALAAPALAGQPEPIVLRGAESFGPFEATRLDVDLRDLPPAAHFVQASVHPGSPVQAQGTLPAGSFRLCVYPNSSYLLGGGYFGGEVTCADLVSGGGAFGPVVVWSAPRLGEDDLLVLRSSDDRTLVAGDRLDEQPGLVVQTQRFVPAPGEPLAVLAILGLAALLLRPLGRRRSTMP
jgi:hypothetical protein